jgi:UDP-N-acetylmuramyl pentapeptide phosphotransferase/UDP-N-acetylglucosamine-1-phosphate transferase
MAARGAPATPPGRRKEPDGAAARISAVEQLFLAAVVSAITTLILIRVSKSHAEGSMRRDLLKPQKLHSQPVPRIGGVGIVLGLVAAALLPYVLLGRRAEDFGLVLLACGMPAFLAGVIQDFTDTLTPRGRLVATALSAVFAYFVLGAAIRETDIPGLDWLVTFGAGSLLLTAFAVAGIAHAVNIIDGLNGLASMCAAIMLAALAYVAFAVGDNQVATLALAGIGAVLGFFLWNFPGGLIFLGDGGAYFLGFFVAELAILLLVRNPSVSPFFPLLVCIYPVFETLFSVYRRLLLRSRPPQVADGIHLHTLVYRRVMRWAVGERTAKALARRNSMTSPLLWMLCTFSVVPAVLFWESTGALLAFLLLFGVSYVVLYWRIVRFRSPRWIFFLATRPRELPREDNRPT